MSNQDDQPQSPVVVLPGAGMTGSPIIPEPVLGTDEGGASPDNLAARIEQTLAEDGRFTSLMNGLSWVADDSGHVTLTGSLPNAALKHSLLATVRALPGVSQVTDRTR